MDELFDLTRDVDLLRTKEELFASDLTGAGSRMARLLASELYLDGMYEEAAETVAATIGWFYDRGAAYRRDILRFEERNEGVKTKSDWLPMAEQKTAEEQSRKRPLLETLRQLMPEDWTIVMICSVPADESEYMLMEEQLGITQTEERSVGTSMVVRVNKTGPSLIMPVRRPMGSNCPKHSLVPVDPWRDSKDCSACWNAFKSLAKIKADMTIVTSKEREKEGTSSDPVSAAHNRARSLVQKMKWFWLKDGVASLLRGVPVSDSKIGTLAEYETLRRTLLAKVADFWRKKAPGTAIREEVNGCIVHMLIELDCAGQPARENGLLLALRDVLVSYQVGNLTDEQCYLLAEELTEAVKPRNLKEASFLVDDRCQRGPVLLALDKDFVRLPWECLADLYGRRVTRVPSVSYVIGELQRRRKRFALSGYTGPRLSRDKLFYLLNPGNDLPKTADRLKSTVTHLPTWKGFIGQEPSSNAIVEALKNCDIYAYFGHGSGNQYLRQDTMDRLSSEALVMLFGCASCDTKPEGQLLEPAGVAHSYLQIGCVGVLGMLYSVTDRDCDEVSKFVFREFLGVGAEGDKPREDYDIVDAVAQGRKLCVRWYNSIAPIFFGLPDIKLASSAAETRS